MTTLSTASILDKLTPRRTAHISTTHPEWPHAWKELADLTGDYADCNPVDGECWQYMGSVREEGTDTWLHQFRHRNRPVTANLRRLPAVGRCYVKVAARPDFVEGGGPC